MKRLIAALAAIAAVAAVALSAVPAEAATAHHNRPCMSHAEYRAIHYGMSHRRVTRIVGSPGVRFYERDHAGPTREFDFRTCGGDLAAVWFNPGYGVWSKWAGSGW